MTHSLSYSPLKKQSGIPGHIDTVSTAPSFTKNSHLDRQVKSRTRISLRACDECKKTKSKCDSEDGSCCTSCSIRNRRCTFLTPRKKRGPKPKLATQPKHTTPSEPLELDISVNNITQFRYDMKSINWFMANINPSTQIITSSELFERYHQKKDFYFEFLLSCMTLSAYVTSSKNNFDSVNFNTYLTEYKRLTNVSPPSMPDSDFKRGTHLLCSVYAHLYPQPPDRMVSNQKLSKIPPISTPSPHFITPPPISSSRATKYSEEPKTYPLRITSTPIQDTRHMDNQLLMLYHHPNTDISNMQYASNSNFKHTSSVPPRSPLYSPPNARIPTTKENSLCYNRKRNDKSIYHSSTTESFRIINPYSDHIESQESNSNYPNHTSNPNFYSFHY